MKKKIIGFLVLGAITLLILLPFRTFSATSTGWVKLLPVSKTQTHNNYEVKKVGTNGSFDAMNVREGANATDKVIPDGEYYVTFWVTGTDARGNSVVDVEHKKKMKFVKGEMQGEIPLTVMPGKITSAGVSYPE